MSEKVDHEWLSNRTVGLPDDSDGEWCAVWHAARNGGHGCYCAEARSAHPQPNAQPTGRVTAVLYPGGEKVEVVAAQPPAPESERGRLVRADDPESREWWRKVHEINDLPSNAMTDLAESDYLAREATDALAVKVARPHQFEAGDYRCKVCGTPWRCHSDGTWSIRTSRLAERCCDDHPGFLLVMEKESE